MAPTRASLNGLFALKKVGKILIFLLSASPVMPHVGLLHKFLMKNTEISGSKLTKCEYFTLLSCNVTD